MINRIWHTGYSAGAATVSPDGKQVGKNFFTNLKIIIKVVIFYIFCRISLVCNLEMFNASTSRAFA